MAQNPVTEVRNVKFDVDRLPRFWHGNRKSVTAFFNNLSIFFPAGERFFIASVRAHRASVTDPALAEDVRTFYGQEGVHTREHIRYNEALAAQGYPVAAMDARVQSLLAFVSRILPSRWQLGVTCALEHYTALMADWLLATRHVLDGAHPDIAALWRWHAAEENEHKAVAFDVFRAIGGMYWERALIMVVATVVFWGKVFEHQVRLMAVDRTLWSPGEWLALVRFLFVSPGGMLKLAGPLLAYFRPSFHPWDHDNRALLEQWKVDFGAEDVYRSSVTRAGGRPYAAELSPSSAA
jgi:predicted metal-dependent hydrolase